VSGNEPQKVGNFLFTRDTIASQGLCSMQDINHDRVTWQITWVQYTSPVNETQVGGIT
jgi:hypothetical protein